MTFTEKQFAPEDEVARDKLVHLGGQCYCEFSFFFEKKSFFLQIKSLLDNQLVKRNEKDVDVILFMSRLQWDTRDSSAGFQLMNSRIPAGRSID